MYLELLFVTASSTVVLARVRVLRRVMAITLFSNRV